MLSKGKMILIFGFKLVIGHSGMYYIKDDRENRVKKGKNRNN